MSKTSPRLDLDAKNNAIRTGMNRDAAMKLQVQQKLAELVDQYNRLNDEQRFAEAEVIAKRAQEQRRTKWSLRSWCRSRR